MTPMLTHAIPALPWWWSFGYAVVFLGMIMEGDMVLFTAALLTHQGYFHLGRMLLMVFGGVFLGDVLWYLAGTRIRSTSWFGRWADRVARPFDVHLRERPLHTIFFSKFAYGIGHALILRAGTLRVDPRTFVRSDLPATLLWAAIVGGLGYFSGLSFALLKHALRIAELAVLIGVGGFLILLHLIAESSKKRL